MISIAHGIRTVFASSDAWGYAASSLVLMTFCMQRMVPLRIVAICSNLAFFTYGLLLHLMPILLLHASCGRAGRGRSARLRACGRKVAHGPDVNRQSSEEIRPGAATMSGVPRCRPITPS